MKNINKILSISVGLFVLLFTSCTEEFPEREPSPVTSANNAQVYFPSTNETSQELDEDATSVSVTIARGNTSGAVTVPLTVLKNDSSIFSIPETVSFADGEAEVSFTVTFTGAIPAVDYTFEVIIDGEELIDAYTVVDGAPAVAVTITLLKWVKFATGIYESGLFGNSWEQELYRAEGSNKFRFFDLYADGYDFNFIWDGGAAITPIGELSGPYYIFDPGVSLPDYGAFTAFVDSDPTYTFYSSAADAFQLEAYWVSETEDIGWVDDYYYISERF